MKLKLLAALMMMALHVGAQRQLELNTHWQCRRAGDVQETGMRLSDPALGLPGWMPAQVPGMVLGSLLLNKRIPDPYYGMNNKSIPDLYDTGPDYYTYWFVNDFDWKPVNGRFVHLNFRGINYTSEVFVNGHRLPTPEKQGMFLRQSFDISSYLNVDGHNRLAVLVHPPPYPGNPNGGQGGDGVIARNVGMQFTAGWDWIQPMHDRNTGIWDKVSLEETGAVRVLDPHIATEVMGKRLPDDKGGLVRVHVSVTVENLSSLTAAATIRFVLKERMLAKTVKLLPHQRLNVDLGVLELNVPGDELWWPNGLGLPSLVTADIQVWRGSRRDTETQFKIGLRSIKTDWNEITHSLQFYVNGQRVFIRGGNWIASDAMLRLTQERYETEVSYHQQMNLNMIRVWGGGMFERPEFYEACDRHGLLVFQDMWMSGDCNGRWLDPLKKDDQLTRRNYPDDHELLIRSLVDQIKMIRNHASLTLWCGGNEITPPEDVLQALRSTILPELDTTRSFIDFSNSSALSNNPDGYNSDGPYALQPVDYFWSHRGYGFNSEMGSAGVGELESLKRFIPDANLHPPKLVDGVEQVDSVWAYHKYPGAGYGTSLEPYGPVTSIADFCKKAQLVNYEQYRALIEGYTSHMWNWYTGILIWKTQNPWTAMRGEMYDHALEPNAGLYGLRKAGEPVHVMYNPVNGEVSAVNLTPYPKSNLRMLARFYEPTGKEHLLNQTFISLTPGEVEHFSSLSAVLQPLAKDQGGLLNLQLIDPVGTVVSSNTYWLKDSAGAYSGLLGMKPARLKMKVQQEGSLVLDLENPGPEPAFFLRIRLVDAVNGDWLASPDDNYISLMPGEQRQFTVQQPKAARQASLELSGWNVTKEVLPLR